MSSPDIPEILDALIAAAEEVQPGSSRELLALLTEDDVARIAKARWPGDPRDIDDAMKRAVAEVLEALRRNGVQRALH